MKGRLKGRRIQKKKRTFYHKRKMCRYCGDKTLQISHRDFNSLRYFITERGKIIPRRISGNCAKHQRQISKTIKRARVISIIPFTVVSV